MGLLFAAKFCYKSIVVYFVLTKRIPGVRSFITRKNERTALGGEKQLFLFNTELNSRSQCQGLLLKTQFLI